METEVEGSLLNGSASGRPASLAIFAIAEMAIACSLFWLAGLFFSAAPQVVPAQIAAAGDAPSFRTPGVVFAALGILFLIAGIGTLRRRNWARVLMMVFSTVWLVTGLAGGVLAAVQLVRRGVPISAPKATILVHAELALTMLVLPTVFFLFYSRQSVRDACLARNAGTKSE